MAPLSAGSDYYVGYGNEGSTYTRGRDSEASYPYSSSDVDITAGCFDILSGNPDSDTTIGATYTVKSVTAVEKKPSGTATIGWAKPADVYRWDAATFQAARDGETVEVYVEESTDGGSTWTEIQGPIGRGDQIEADPRSRVRFRVELARSDTSNNPTLDAIYRRWVV